MLCAPIVAPAGSTWLCSNSVEHSGAPKGSGFVRAEHPFAGWRVTPHPTDLFCCRIGMSVCVCVGECVGVSWMS